MLKIKIDLVPLGIFKSSSSWQAEICNDGSGTHSIGNYYFNIFQKNSDKIVWKSGEVKNFQRKKWSVWYLIYLCLKEIYE